MSSFQNLREKILKKVSYLSQNELDKANSEQEIINLNELFNKIEAIVQVEKASVDFEEQFKIDRHLQVFNEMASGLCDNLKMSIQKIEEGSNINKNDTHESNTSSSENENSPTPGKLKLSGMVSNLNSLDLNDTFSNQPNIDQSNNPSWSIQVENDSIRESKSDESPSQINKDGSTLSLNLLELTHKSNSNSVQLFEFDGDWKIWIPFKESFLQWVIMNPKLSDSTKLRQLKYCTRGSAFEIVKSHTSFQMAWEGLSDKYESKSQIIEEYLKGFFELPYLKENPTKDDFLKIISRTSSLIQVFAAFEYDTGPCEPILIFCITARLNASSFRKWKDVTRTNKNPRLSQLMEFIQFQVAEVRRAKNQCEKATKKAFHSKTKKKIRKTNRICLYCGESHAIYNCKSFKEADLARQFEYIRNLDRCLKCFEAHLPEECKFRNCKWCDNPHNNLFCSKNHSKS